MRLPIRWLAAVLFLASIASADTVYLKSGRRIECEKAWEEGKEIKYQISEGTVGIPRSMVAKIVKSDSTDASPPAAASQTAPTQSQPSDVLTQETREKLATAYTIMANDLVEKKDLAGALEYLKKAYEMTRTRETTFNLAAVYYALKDEWNASLLFHELLRLDPRNTEAMNCLADMAWRKEDLDEAEAYWKKSLSIKQDPEIKLRLERLKKEKKASDGYDGSTTRHFLMKYDGGAANTLLVDQITDFMEETYQQLSSQFEEYPGEPFVVVLYPAREYVNVTEAPYWSGGVNDGKIKLPIGGLSSLNDELRRVLVHELTHSFVNIKSSGNCPTWLQEGLAQRTEGKILSSESLKGLRAMAEQKSLPSMKQLGGSFTSATSEEAGVLYVISYSFTEFLIDRYRFSGINSLLEKLGAGESFDAAFAGAYSFPISEAEEKWRRSLEE